MKKKTYSQLVIVEYHNCAPYLETFVANHPITIQEIANYLDRTEGFCEDVDSLTFVNSPGKRILL